MDRDTFSFPEHCGGQHQQQEPSQPARLALWNENIPLLLLLSGVVAVWIPCSGLVCLGCPCGSSWPRVGAIGREHVSTGQDTAGKCSSCPLSEHFVLSDLAAIFFTNRPHYTQALMPRRGVHLKVKMGRVFVPDTHVVRF